MSNIDQSNLDPASRTLSPLPPVLSQGLIPVALFGSLSFIFSTSLFLFLTYRLIAWRRQSRSQEPTSQFFLLIYNLVLADIQQSIAFLLNAASLGRDSLTVGTSSCWAQGWFVSTGDLAGSVWILAIAVHTFLAVVKGYKLPRPAFYCAIAGLWTFVYATAIVGAVLHPTDLYVRAGAWCWINAKYQPERLWLHYFWIFVAMFSTIVIYSSIVITLRHRRTSASATPHGATPLMILYPAIYAICTTPLAAGRIASMAGRDVDLTYFCVAGSMIACNGWLDVLLYSLTRRSIVFADERPEDTVAGLDTFQFLGEKKMGTVTTIEGGLHKSSQGAFVHGRRASSRVASRKERRFDSTASTENLYKDSLGLGLNGGIKTETTIDVRVAREPREIFELQNQAPRGSNGGGTDKASWDTKSGRSFDE